MDRNAIRLKVYGLGLFFASIPVILLHFRPSASHEWEVFHEISGIVIGLAIIVSIVVFMESIVFHGGKPDVKEEDRQKKYPLKRSSKTEAGSAEEQLS